MKPKDQIDEWWIKALLGEAEAAHPVFGSDVDVSVEDNVITLTGQVATRDQFEELDDEARAIGRGREVVNRVIVLGADDVQHMQTVLALFGSEEQARLACQLVSSSPSRHEGPPQVVSQPSTAESRLKDLARPAGVQPRDVERVIDRVRHGKTLLIDRVPEDDAFRVISELEGTAAELVQTLPPEPESTE